MTTDLESDIRAALAGRAAEIAPDASARLRGIDYRPRGRRVSTGVGVTAGLVGAAATAGIVSAVTLGTSAPAFAGWSPTPSATSAVLTASSGSTGPQQSCQSQVDQMSSPPGTTDTDPTSWTPVATDVRGPFTLVVFKSGSDQATCLTGPSVTAVSQGSASGLSGMAQSVSGSVSVGGPGHGSATSSAEGGRGSQDITWFSEMHVNPSAGELTMMDGQLDAGVTGVSLVRSDGSQVQATVGDGWFVAWWPGDLDSSSALVTTAGGTATVSLSSTLPKPPAPGSSNGSPALHVNCTQSPTSPGAVCSGAGSMSSGSTGPTTGVGASSGPTVGASSGPAG